MPRWFFWTWGMLCRLHWPWVLGDYIPLPKAVYMLVGTTLFYSAAQFSGSFMVGFLITMGTILWVTTAVAP